MTKKTLGNGSRIISTHTRNIDNKRADERPVGSGIIVLKGSGIFAQKHILNPMQTILNSPVLTNPLRKCKRRGKKRADVIIGLVGSVFPNGYLGARLG